MIFQLVREFPSSNPHITPCRSSYIAGAAATRSQKRPPLAVGAAGACMLLPKINDIFIYNAYILLNCSFIHYWVYQLYHFHNFLLVSPFVYPRLLSNTHLLGSRCSHIGAARIHTLQHEIWVLHLSFRGNIRLVGYVVSVLWLHTNIYRIYSMLCTGMCSLYSIYMYILCASIQRFSLQGSNNTLEPKRVSWINKGNNKDKPLGHSGMIKPLATHDPKWPKQIVICKYHPSRQVWIILSQHKP